MTTVSHPHGVAPAGTRRNWLLLAPLAGLIAIFTVPFGPAPTICPFALITGIPCPGCGLTRAVVALGHGDIGSAVAFHPLVGVVLAWFAGTWLVAVARRRGVNISLDRRVVDRLLWATAALFVITWLVRMGTGTLPPV